MVCYKPIWLQQFKFPVCLIFANWFWCSSDVLRDTMLQAFRGCISGAGGKISDVQRRQMVSSLEGFLSTPEDTTRTTAAACLGAFCACLPSEELTSILINQLLGIWHRLKFCFWVFSARKYWFDLYDSQIILYGPVCKFLSKFIDTDPSQDWTLRHGRAVALFIALKEAPGRILPTELRDKVLKAIHVYTTADRVSVFS